MKTKILKRILYVITLIVFQTACTKEKNIGSEAIALNAYETKEIQTVAKENRTKQHQHKIIKNAKCKIKVDRIKPIRTQVEALVLKNEGYITKENYINNQYNKESEFTVRIPNQKFQQIIDSICELGVQIDYRNIYTNDVTQEFVDIEMRLKTKEEVRQRYEEILRAKAKNVKDLLLTEEKLSKIQSEIEIMKGRIQYLSNQTAMSTITVILYEEIEERIITSPTYLQEIKKALIYGWDMIKTMSIGILYLWPFIVIGLIIIYYYRRKTNTSK